MAFITPQYEYYRVKLAVREQFPQEDHDEVYALLEPFIEDGGSRLPLSILKLAAGRKELVGEYAQHARKDYRDVLYWADCPEARLDTPEKIDEFQDMLEWLGAERDSELDRDKERVLEEQRTAAVQNEKREPKRPWWRFW
jgi:hypothetical protein